MPPLIQIRCPPSRKINRTNPFSISCDISDSPRLGSYTQPELASALAGGNHCRGRQEGPVEILVLAQELEKFAALCRFNLIGGGKLRRVDELHAGRDFQTAGAADDEIALHARLPDRLDQELRIARGEMNRADHGV